jgi:predicted dehydrogenase
VVAGLGRIGRLHARNLTGHVATAELAAVVDAVEPRARSLGELHGVPWFTSLDSAVAREVDGVVIAAPTALHPELVEATASAGKHVFCEKPLGFEIESSRRAVGAAEAAGVHLQVGFQRRFDPDWMALDEALRGGELGELRLLRCSHRDAGDREAAAALGDVFVDLAVHDLDAARWLGGDVAQVFALTRPASGGPIAAAAAIALRFDSGALALVDVCRGVRYGFECSAELVGSRATARLGYAGHRGVELLRDGRAAAPLAADHAERHDAAYVRELEAFGELVLGRRPSVPSGDDAVAALELALLARRSAELGVPLDAAAARSPLAVAGRSR